ncbi:DUF1254 domain-containing protein [Palleronia sp. KMU-117]|uniref:DUF1254 domain-containing protein n=1 Tax=Palleronia sp. KMU-117 TaxID=3434108 RepID=UPI003D7515F3
MMKRILLCTILIYAPTVASSEPIAVNPDNFVRAESDLYFGNTVANGGFGRFDHTREPAPIDKQTVIRLNRDTIYSAAVFDLDAGPVTITKPDSGERYMSMQVIDQDHYTFDVVHEPGPFTLTREAVGTRYVIIGTRTLVDPNDPEDMAAAHALQDAIKVEQDDVGTFDAPEWDKASQDKVRAALLELASMMPDTRAMYGSRDETEPVRFLIGAAQGWGGLAATEALYLNVVPERNDGETVHLLRVDPEAVPVGGFWSVSLYNAEGYYVENEYDAYTLNNITAERSPDGLVVIQFGGCDGVIANCLPTPPGWNYMVRLYRPSEAILNGSWTFPVAEPVE